MLEATQKKEKEDFFYFRRYENFVLALGFVSNFILFSPFFFRVKAITNEEKQKLPLPKNIGMIGYG